MISEYGIYLAGLRTSNVKTIAYQASYNYLANIPTTQPNHALKAYLTFCKVHISEAQCLRLSSTAFFEGWTSEHAEGEPVVDDMGTHQRISVKASLPL